MKNCARGRVAAVLLIGLAMLDVVEAIQQLNVAKLRVVSTQVDLAQLRLALEDTTGTLLERLSVEL